MADADVPVVAPATDGEIVDLLGGPDEEDEPLEQPRDEQPREIPTVAQTQECLHPSSGNSRTEECPAWPEVPADLPVANAQQSCRGRPPGVSNQPLVLVPDTGLINLNIRPYKCPHCSKGFADQWHLRRHVRIHTGDRPFVCPFCHMAFNQKNTLIGHMRRHTGDKPYRCQECHMAFSWKSTFVKHVQQHGSEHLALSVDGL
ncbi:hypothetical protein HPB50_007550 [Hyalomma asiaticum]|uniref:Uncharacterized protein n=1 Tax=Hyalomma asiaticum TaxID=266040 RepID=A0ACB7RHS7_HYAAI|nr:hypothetical protein HPB50_007550 [Hyalomma asiaticum]